MQKLQIILKALKDLFTPNKRVPSTTYLAVIIIWTIGTLTYWSFSSHQILPTPFDIIQAGQKLFVSANLFGHILNSMMLCLKAMFYAITISYALATISTLTFFQPIAKFFAQARFLTTVGLSVIFAQLTADTSSQKTALLVFSITVFLVTSFLGVIADIKKGEYDYAKTLKMGHWRAFWEIIVLGKSDQFLEAIRQNFAIAWMMLPMVETFCRADGGIGIILTDQNKYFHLDAVYAIQIIVLFIGIGLDLALGWIKGVVRPDTLINAHK